MKIVTFDSNITKNWFQWSKWEYASIDSDTSLASNRQQAIIWINDGSVYKRIYGTLNLNELDKYLSCMCNQCYLKYDFQRMWTFIHHIFLIDASAPKPPYSVPDAAT